jgi:prevent-host-death family protein
MKNTISAKTLRRELGKILERVRRGERFTVLYRSRPVCDLVPPGGPEREPGPLEDDTIFTADAIAVSEDGLTSEDHDRTLYGRE